jgi:hypothetical protein
MICAYNDLIWWLPFGLFLIRGTWLGRRAAETAPWLCVAVHVAALAALFATLRSGTAAESSDIASRATYVANNTLAWSIGWGVWMLAAATLVGFYAWWGQYLVLSTESVSSAGARCRTEFGTNAAVVLTAFGLVCDFSGEGLAILRLVEHAPRELAGFAIIERQFTLLSAGAANGLYTIAGVMLTLLTPNLPRWVRWAMWVTWLAGAGMTIAAIANSVTGIVVSTSVLFPLFLLWVSWMGARWRPA